MANTNSVYSIGTTIAGSSISFWLVNLIDGFVSPKCATLNQNVLSLTLELVLGKNKSPVSSALVQDNLAFVRYTSSTVSLGVTSAGVAVELAFISMLSGCVSQVCATLTQDGMFLIWFGIGGHVTPVCATYNQRIGSAWAQAQDWAQDMEWVTEEWLRLILQTNYGGFNIQNFGGIANPVNIGGIDD